MVLSDLEEKLGKQRLIWGWHCLEGRLFMAGGLVFTREVGEPAGPLRGWPHSLVWVLPDRGLGSFGNFLSDGQQGCF